MWRCLPLLLTACGAPVYFPTEPRNVGTFGEDTGPGTEAIPCSGFGTAYVSMRIDNRTEGTLELYFRNFNDCTEIFYGNLAPGYPLDQITADTHVWVVRDPFGTYVDHRVLDATPQVEWVIE